MAVPGVRRRVFAVVSFCELVLNAGEERRPAFRKYPTRHLLGRSVGSSDFSVGHIGIGEFASGGGLRFLEEGEYRFLPLHIGFPVVEVEDGEGLLVGRPKTGAKIQSPNGRVVLPNHA